MNAYSALYVSMINNPLSRYLFQDPRSVFVFIKKSINFFLNFYVS